MADSESESDDDQRRFQGQRLPTLLTYFQSVLRRYPDGGQILKELLQNADDAGATEVKFLLDTRQHSSKGLLHKTLAHFQGPALYAYNNSTFSDSDWGNLMNVDQSKKKGELMKVGRFGLGFISVYHMTDFPTIVSGDTVAFLDPHEKHLPHRATGTSRSVRSVLQKYPGHAATFQGVLGCHLKETEMFNGTLFRFPLRQSESQLSPTVYDVNDVKRKLFTSFNEESEKVLLFLKHVQAVELYERNSTSTQEELLLKMCVSPQLQAAVAADRLQLAEEAQLGFCESRFFSQTSALSTTIWSPTDGQKDQHFCVVNCIDTRHHELNELGCRLKLLPWVSAACPLPEQLDGAEKMSMDSEWLEHPLLPTGGNAFCFLPLPNQTGCPVHLNGYFAVQDNRRSIKWPLHDDTGDEARWNKLLVEMVLSQAYSLLLKSVAAALDPQTDMKAIVSSSGRHTLAYAAWPDLDQLRTTDVWNALVEPLGDSIGTDSPVFWTAVSGGQCVSLNTAWFLDDLDDADEEEKRIVHSVATVMLAAGKPVVILPHHVRQWLQNHTALLPAYNCRLVSPAVLRATIRDLLTTPSGKGIVQVKDKALHLLDFVLRDENYNDLDGLPLLPMANGSFAALGKEFSNPHGSTIFLSADTMMVELLPNLEGLFVDVLRCNEVMPCLIGKLRRLAESHATQLSLAAHDHVPGLLLQSINTWAGAVVGSGQAVAWTPGKNPHPDSVWLEKLWKWLTSQADKISLTKMSSCPLLPSSWQSPACYLHTPSLSSACIAPSSDGQVEKMTEYLQELGCYMMNEHAPPCKHPEFNKVVHPPTAGGILDALLAAAKHSGQQEFLQRLSSNDPSGIHRGRLRAIFNNVCASGCTPFTFNQLDFLCCLPLFDTIPARQLVAVRDGYQLPPSGVLPPDVSTPPKLLDPDKCQESAQLLAKLNLHCLDEEMFILDIVLPHLSSCSTRDKVTYALHITTRSRNLSKQQLSLSRFIPTNHTGTLMAPAELYDPTDSNLKQLFLPNEDVFPCCEISQSKVHIAHLNSLGLQTIESLTKSKKEDLVIERARKMASFSKTNGLEKVIDRAKILLNLLESLLDNGQVDTQLKAITWLPTEPQVPPNYPHGLKWYGEVVMGNLMAPSDLRVDAMPMKYEKDHSLLGASRDEFLVGASRAMINNKLKTMCQESQSLCTYFGWDAPCKGSEVVEQLKLLVEMASQFGEGAGDELQEAVEHNVMAIYAYLQHHWNDLSQVSLPKKWVWVRKASFVEPERIILGMANVLCNINLEPYRYVLHTKLRKNFQYLFKECVGIKLLGGDGGGDCELLSLLQDIADEKPKLTTDSEVDVYCQLLKLIGNFNSLNSSSVLIPRYDMTLCPPETCSYPDQDSMHWLITKSFNKEEMAKYNVIHSRLDPDVARNLSVRPLSSQLIKAKRLSAILSPLGRRYGPKETLMRRLKGILEDYPGDSTILKELVQNADDAKASEVRIMVDWRGYGSTPKADAAGLLHPNMSTWQGPAIWVYNNAEFSDADFENIVQLAGATKESQAGKIGRFGLGFNAVYHLTDVPSFVSRRFVSFFDPHAKYIPNHVCASDPGVQIDFVNEQSELKRSFPDQFSTYEGIFGCSILSCNSEHGFGGTLFRFPLRSGVHSDICNKEYTPPHVQQLLTSFQEEMKNILIFLQFVRKISVFELPESAHSPSEAVLVSSCELSVSSEMSTFSPENVSPTSLLCRLTTDKDQIEGHLLQWLSHQEGSSSSLCSSVPPFVLYQAVVKLQGWGKLSGPTSQSLSVDRNHHDCTQLFTWLVCSGGGGQQAADLAVQSGGQLFPWAGVAIPMKIADNGIRTVESLSCKTSRVYCFLPLTINAGFPFHVNGFFAVDKTRRYLCYDSMNQNDQRTMWNIAIVTSTLPRLMCELIKPVRPVIPQKISLADSQEHLKKYFQVWPTAGSGLWHNFLTAFYVFLASDESFPLLWTPTNGGEWKLAEECIILNAHQELPGELFLVAVDALASLGHSVALAPCDVERQLLNVMTCWDFEWFAQVLFEHLNCIDNTARDRLIHHMLTSDLMKKDRLFELFKTYSCIKTVGRSLKKPCELINPHSNLLQCLYDDNDDRFPSDVYGDQITCQALIRLGMQSEKLNIEDIIERAESVSQLSTANEEKAILRTSNLLVFLETAQLSNSERMDLEGKLPGIPFLPVCHRPPGQPLRWWAEDQTSKFQAGEHVWPGSCSALLSSQAAILNKDLLKVKGSSATLALCGVGHSKQVPIELVHGQLKQLIDCRSLLIKLTKEQAEFFEVSTQKIYGFLERTLKRDASEEESSRIADRDGGKLHKFLLEQPWIWHSENFQAVHVFSYDWEGGDHLPYFCQVPKHMSNRFPHLLRYAGVKQNFLLDHYLSASQDLFTKHQDSEMTTSKRNIILLLHLAKLIKEERGMLDSDAKSKLCEQVVLPSRERQLCYVKNLTYDDMPWVPSDSPIKARYTYLHDDFPRELAESLGMKTLRLLCSDVLSGDQLFLTGDLYGEDFGQNELLCDRLEQILRNYPADVTIFKELIQNADDCGATEIHFILDSTEYEDHKLYNESESWAGLQRRPALCVFNNRPFTEDDIKGISRLGRGGKRNDPSTVGRFGIGFNAVYHLTDCPMFVSRGPGGQPQNMCLFDPRCKHWPFATERSPGRHWCLTKEKEDVFPDQFAPFLKDSLQAITDTDIGSTVFRLPLREKKDASVPMDVYERTHPISMEEWNQERILELLRELCTQVRAILLFLNNVQRIAASVKDKGGIHELFFATSSLTNDAVLDRQRFARAVKQYSCENVNSQVTQAKYHLDITQTTRHTSETKHWQDTLVLKPLNNLVFASPLANLKQGAVYESKVYTNQPMSHALDCKIGKVHESWLILQSLGVESLKVSKESHEILKRGQEFALLPRGGVAVPLAGTRLGFEGRAYTFLPLPITTGFPVHVNADFVLDDGRRFISTSTRSHDIDNVWNKFVLSEIVPELYTQTLCLATERPGEKQRVEDAHHEHLGWFYSLFPRHDHCTSPVWKQVGSFVYQKLASRNAKILSYQLQAEATKSEAGKAATADHEDNDSTLDVVWLPVTGEQHGIFHHLGIGGDKTGVPLLNLLLTCGMKLTSAPDFLKTEFSKHHVELSMLTPELVCNFLRCMVGHGYSDISKLPFAAGYDFAELIVNISTLLNYCLSDWAWHPSRDRWGVQYSVDACLEGLPLLVTADSMLRYFHKRNSVFLPDFHELLPQLPQKFLHEQLLGSSFLRKLHTTSEWYTTRKSNIVIPLSVQHFADAVTDSQLPLASRQGRAIVWDRRLPNTEWLKLLWEFLMKHYTFDVFSACRRFSIIPTTTGKLMPLCQAEVIAKPCQSTLKETMKQMGCPFSDFASLFGEKRCDHVNQYLANQLADILDTSAAIRCLLAVHNSDGLNVRLEPGRLDQLLQHLLSQDFKLSDNDIVSLKKLPLYPTIDGERVALRSGRSYFWPRDMPECGLDSDRLFTEADLVLLNPQCHVVRLNKRKLHVEDIDVAELYSNYLFAQLKEIGHADLCQHLEFIRDKVFQQHNELPSICQRHPKAEELLSKLKTLPFVTVQQCPDCDAQSVMQKICAHTHLPSKLFDPSHAVFAVRLTGTQFPHQKWLGGAWKEFLKRLGLQSALPRHLFLQYVKDVHAHALCGVRTCLADNHRSTSVDWQKLSNTLCENMFSEQLINLSKETAVRNTSDWLNSPDTTSFLQEVGCIPFLFRQDQLQCVQYIKKLLPEEEVVRLTVVMRSHALVKFQGSALDKDAALVWSTLPVLPSFQLLWPYSTEQKALFHMLGIGHPPEPVYVAHHLVKLCNSLRCRNTPLLPAGSAKEQLYHQLDRIYNMLGTVCSNDPEGHVANILKDVRCILVNHRQSEVPQNCFILARQLCWSIEEEIQPCYLLQVPHRYNHLQSLFKSLGTTDRPTAGQYAGVLRILHKEHGETPLREGSCGLNAAIQAVGGLVRCLRAKNKDNPPKEGEEYPTAEHLQPLYLPTEDLVLLPSDRLVYPDSPHFYNQLVHTGMFKFVISLSQCGDHGEPNGLTLPPRGMGLHLLSQLVTKRLADGTLDNRNLAILSPHSKLAHNLDSLQVILASAEFATAVRRLHFHQHKSQHSDQEEALLQQLQDCEMSCVKQLLTVSVHSQTGNVIEGTEANEACYIQRPTTCWPNAGVTGEESLENSNDMCCEPAVVCIQAQGAVDNYLSFLSLFAREIGVYLRSSGDLLPLFQVLHARCPKEIPAILDKYGITPFHDRRSQPYHPIYMKYGIELTGEEQLLLVDDPTLPLLNGECVAYKEREDTAPVTALVLGEVEDDLLKSGPPFLTKWKLRVGDSSSESGEAILASQLQLYKFQKSIMLRPELALGECDENPMTALALAEEDMIGSESEQHGLEIEEHRQDLSKLVQQAAKLPTEECEKLLCRLWKAYHPAKQPSDAHPEYADLFGHLLQCVQNVLDGQTASRFRELVEDRLVPELQGEADMRHKMLRATGSARRVRRNGLFSRPEPDEVHASPRQQFGVAIQHPVSYLPVPTLPGPWMGGDWCFVHSNTPGRQQHHHLQESSCANEEIVFSITQIIVDLRQYFARKPLDVHDVLGAYPAWSKAYSLVEQLLQLSLQCYVSSEESAADSADIAEMLKCLQPFLYSETHRCIMDSISSFHVAERSAHMAWKAAEAILGYLLDDMKQQLGDTKKHARILQLLSNVEQKKLVSSGDEQKENLPRDQV